MCAQQMTHAGRGARLSRAFNSMQHSNSYMVSCLQLQEDDVIGVLNSTDIAQLLPIGDRILVEVRMLFFCLLVEHT